MEKNTLTWDEVLAAPGVERLQDAERHLDGWLIRHESPVFRAVVAAVELGVVHGHGGHQAPCYLYYTTETTPDGTKQENWYPVWWKPGSYNLDEFDHPAVAASDPSWWAAGINADGVLIPGCEGNCPELGEYRDGEWVQTRSCQVGRGNCRGLALDHTTGTGRLDWAVAQDSVTIRVHRPGRKVAEITIPLAPPYEFRVWAPIHRDGLRPRHVDALMTALNAVVGVTGYEFPGGSPGDALGTLWNRFGVGYSPDGEPDETPVGVLLTQDPKELLGVAVYGDPDAPAVVE